MMSKQTVIYIGGFELPDKNAAAHRVLNNAKIIKEMGKEVILIGVDKSLNAESKITETKKIINGFTTYSVPYPSGGKDWLKYLISINQYIVILKDIKNISGIIYYNFQSIAMRRLMSFSNKRSIKNYSDVTEWYSSRGRGLLFFLSKSFDTTYRMKVLHKKMHGLIVISRYLEKYYSKCEKVVYIPALTDINEKKWENSYEKSKEKLFLVYAGNPGKKDKLNDLIRALSEVKREYQLDIVGITKEDYVKNNDEMSYSENENVYFHGKMSHIKALDFVKKANYSVLLRDEDRVSKAGFPTKFSEAITSGTPMLINRTSNVSEYINNNNAILINSLHFKDIASAIDDADYQIDVIRDTFYYKKYLPEFLTLFDEECK